VPKHIVHFLLSDYTAPRQTFGYPVFPVEQCSTNTLAPELHVNKAVLSAAAMNVTVSPTTERDDGTDDAVSGNRLTPVAFVPSRHGARSTAIYLQLPASEEKDEHAVPKVIVKEDNQTDPSTHPHSTSDEETHIIISTGSGTGKAELFYEQAVKPILETLWPEATTIQELTNDIFFPTANAGITLRIVLLTGDGGIIDLVNGLLSQPTSSSYIAPKVVLLPLGTANALYHSINVGNPQQNTWGLKALCLNPSHETHRKSLPIFAASFSPGARLLTNEARDEEVLPQDPKSGCPVLHGAVVASWAMHASLVADSDTAEYRKFGIDRFKMAAKEALYPADGSPPHPYRASVSVLHGSEWTPIPEEEHMYVLATMVSNLEQPFCISPRSGPLDGSLWLVHFGPTSGDEAMRVMGMAYEGGKHVEDPMVRYEEIDGLSIQFQEKDDRWRRVCVDGKIVRVEDGGWMEIRKEERRLLDVVVE
jgi:diacylglycerol kinase family enzyme